MKTSIYATLAAITLALPAAAQGAGDPAKGEKEFRKCKACHMIQAPDGTDVVKGGKTGPNLYGVVGRKAGTEEGFKYSDALIKLGEAGEVWTTEDLEHYITNPNKYVEEKVGDKSLKTKMTFKLAKNQADVVAFLAQHSPEAVPADTAPAPADAASGDAAAAAPTAEAPAAN
ncbi:c-type cytochrome [Paracoccus binzhouensis]|uniref:c-type cytochrome n=1 Tax=Paracoccus binzhouensis TaxID=2796149 RepID=UPI0018EF04F0|nr:cytochrome C [Paracoccus binzhouensis]